MSKRNRREHGRILSVETMQRGSALDVDAAAGATSITVTDAGDFDEDGGWLYIGAQVVAFTACDDDTGNITILEPLTIAAEQGDPVNIFDPLYGEIVDYQVALVQLDGEHDNPDPVEAEVAEGVSDLPEGDRGQAGESCTLLRVADDEWEIVGVGGRSRKSRGLRAEADDAYSITQSDVDGGVATIPLQHRPADEWVIAFWGGVAQRPSNYTINYDEQTVTWPLSGFEEPDDVLWVHYAYRKGFPRLRIPFGAPGWSYKILGISDATDYSAKALDDSTWAVGPAAFGDTKAGSTDNYAAYGGFKTLWPLDGRIWLRRHFGRLSHAQVSVRIDNYADIYWNGTLLGSFENVIGNTENMDDPYTVDVPSSLLHTSTNVLAIRATDDTPQTLDQSLIDVQVTGG